MDDKLNGMQEEALQEQATAKRTAGKDLNQASTNALPASGAIVRFRSADQNPILLRLEVLAAQHHGTLDVAQDDGRQRRLAALAESKKLLKAGELDKSAAAQATTGLAVPAEGKADEKDGLPAKNDDALSLKAEKAIAADAKELPQTKVLETGKAEPNSAVAKPEASEAQKSETRASTAPKELAPPTEPQAATATTPVFPVTPAPAPFAAAPVESRRLTLRIPAHEKAAVLKQLAQMRVELAQGPGGQGAVPSGGKPANSKNAWAAEAKEKARAKEKDGEANDRAEAFVANDLKPATQAPGALKLEGAVANGVAPDEQAWETITILLEP